jgi:hypothetical protein
MIAEVAHTAIGRGKHPGNTLEKLKNISIDFLE